MKSIHRTASGRKAKELREEARTWKGEARKIRASAPELEPAARLREEEARRLEGEALEALERARLEAVTVYLGPVEKTTAKGTKTYRYPEDDPGGGDGEGAGPEGAGSWSST